MARSNADQAAVEAYPIPAHRREPERSAPPAPPRRFRVVRPARSAPPVPSGPTRPLRPAGSEWSDPPHPRPPVRSGLSSRASMLPDVSTLGEPLTRALGARTGKALESVFGMRTVSDLLRHYPRRYYTRGELTDLSALREGDHVTVLARIDLISLRPMPHQGPRSRGEVIVTDGRGKLMLTFFFRSPKSQFGFRKLAVGMVGMFAGTVSSFRGRPQLIHPEFEMLPTAPDLDSL